MVDDRIDKKGWRKFSISEVVWMQIIIELRKFDYPLDKIRNIKHLLDQHNLSSCGESKCLLLDFYLARSAMASTPIKLLAFATGEGVLGSQVEIDMSLAVGAISDNCISVDFNRMAAKILPKIKVPDYMNYSASKIEDEVRTALYYNNVKSISIRTLNDKEFLVEKTQIIESKKELESLLHKLEYGSVRVDKKRNTKVYSQQEKKKIKK